jgi:thiamine-phosphate pyrophosphorylase
VWQTPSKSDADPPIGLEGLAEICRAVTIPVVAIGGVNASNAGECIRAGATGVAVIRAATEARALREAIDRAAV